MRVRWMGRGKADGGGEQGVDSEAPKLSRDTSLS